MANTKTKKTVEEVPVEATETTNNEETVTDILNDIKSEGLVSDDTKTNDTEENSNDTSSILSDIQSGLQDVAKSDIKIDTKTENVKIKPDELIPVRSMIRGGFNWRCGKSRIPYRWASIGHVEYLPYDDLYQMYTNNKHYLTKAFLLVEDERVIKVFKLLDVYKDIAVVNRLVGKAANNVSVMRDVCEQAIRLGMRDFLVERLCQMRSNGTLTNADAIDEAQKVLGCTIQKN